MVNFAARKDIPMREFFRFFAEANMKLRSLRFEGMKANWLIEGPIAESE